MNMRNSKLLFWGSFAGALVVVALIVIALNVFQENRMAKLEKMFSNWVSVEGNISSF